MSLAPSVELRFNPTDLRPRDLPSVGAFLGSPSDALEAALSVARSAMVDQIKSEVQGLSDPTQAQLLRIADLAWQGVFWKFRKVSAPVIADAYIRAYRRADAGDVPMSVIYDLADKHAEKIGDYFHTSSRAGLADGFTSMVNRRVPAKAASNMVLNAFGLTPRQMRAYVSATQFRVPVMSMTPQALKARAASYIFQSFHTRIKKMAKQEEHNIDQQAQQFAWMWLQDKGRLTARAEKVWITAHDEHVCKICGPLHGQKVLVNEQFHTKEGDFWTPGLHPNCRCTVRLLENTFSIEKADWEEKLHPRSTHGRFTRVGFTGTLKGMTPEQEKGVRAQLSQDMLLAHGSAVGADEQAAKMAHELGMYVVAHPASDVAPAKVADTKAHLKRHPKPALERNQSIVEQTDRLVAAPRGPEKSYPRSGTWATVRRARKEGKPVTVVMPDGTIEDGEKKPYEITQDDREHYVNERCNDLALVIHQRTGWPVWGVFTTNADDEREEAWWHTGVITPDGQWLDVLGKRDLGEVADEWSEYLYEEGDVDLDPVQDFGKDDGSEVTPRAKKIADALLAEHEIKKDDWEPKLHPRGGDPENRGRFSRVPKVMEREKPVIAVPSILDDLKPETQTETETKESFKIRGDTEEGFKLGGDSGAFSLSGKPFSLGEKKFSLAEQKFELGGQEKFELEQGKAFNLSREEIAAKIKLAPEIKLKMIAETEKFLIGDVTEYVKPKVTPNKLFHKPVIWVHDVTNKQRPYYAVVEEDTPTDGYMFDLNHDIDFTPNLGSVAQRVVEVREDKIVDGVDTIFHALDQDPLYLSPNEAEHFSAEIDPEDVAGMLRWVDNSSRFGVDDRRITINWVDRGGSLHPQIIRYSELWDRLGDRTMGVDLEVRVMRLDEAHDSRKGQTVHRTPGAHQGFESWRTEGSYVMKDEKSVVVHSEPGYEMKATIVHLDPEVEEEELNTEPLLGGE